MFIRMRPQKTIVESGGDSSAGTGYARFVSVDKDPLEWTEAERDYMAGCDPKTAPLERRIAKLEDALRRAKQKLVLYRAEHSGEYTNLMEIIDAALGE